MCGIAGFIGLNEQGNHALLAQIAEKMASTIRHRGPDDSGIWVDSNAGIAMGHRRLSIIDLSVLGHQPMISSSGRYVIVYNGEVYNFPELRAELEKKGYAFKGHSDTEVILSAFEEWGIEEAVKQFVGMFAFALWDRTEQRLWLGRDRIGKKPLYYGWLDRGFCFASELKALTKCPRWSGEINRDVLALFMRYNYIPAPYSIYKNIYKLYPGTLLSIRLEDAIYGVPDFSPMPVTEGADKCRVQPVPYWSLRKVYQDALENPFDGSESEAEEILEDLLRKAVQCRMISDVPLGALLSGGIDSSLVVALMQNLSSQPVKTFTIGFYESDYNEAPYADAIARWLGTNHTQLYVKPEETMRVLDMLPSIYDEPFADSSQIPTYIVCELTRKYVTVALSGDAGDENFAGYTGYMNACTMWRRIGWIPLPFRILLSRILSHIPVPLWQAIRLLLRGQIGDYLRTRDVSESLYRVAELISVPDFDGFFHGVSSHWKHPLTLVLNSSVELPTIFIDPKRKPPVQPIIRRMMFMDKLCYLPDDILVKVDRASMAVSLEVRAPLLDHRVIEFAARLPLNFLVTRYSRKCPLQGKYILRRILYKYIPPELVERPKRGFSVPVGMWIRGPLRAWAEDMLSEQRLKQEGYLNVNMVRDMWKQHVIDGKDRTTSIWCVLMFEAWLEHTKKQMGK